MRKAGFPFTIYSLWPSDKSKDNIGLLVSAFYRKLRRDSPFKALRLSQLRVKQRKDHPFYWAGILLHKHSQER
jgi:CHAT domain-containing protein